MKKYLLFFILFILTTKVSISQTINWDADNGVGNFSFCNNWFGDACPTSFGGFHYGNELQFSFRNNGSQTTTYYDLGWNNIKSIIYMTTYGQSTPLSGNGNGLNFDIKVENLSSFAQTVNIPLSGAKNGSAVIELNPVNADLTIGGILFNDNNKIINVYGSNAKVLKLNNYIVGNESVNLNIKQNSKVVLNYDMASQGSAFSGGVNIDIGEFWFEQGASINGGTIKVGIGNSNTAKLYINDADGGTTVNNAVSVPAGSTNSYIGGLNTSGTNTFSGNVSLSAPVTLEAWAGGTVNFTGGISGAQAVNIGKVSGSGTGTIIYSANAKTYSGLTTITSGALLKINLANAIPSTNNVTVNASGTLQISANQTLSSLVNNGVVVIDPGVTLTVSSITGSGTITGSSTSNLIITGTGSNLNFTSGSRILKDLSLTTGATATLGTALDITAGSTPGTVTVGSSATLTSNGNLTLKSDDNGTARVATSAGTISGDVTVERNIKATTDHRAWHLLSVNTTGTQTIRSAWQEEGGPIVANQGTLITSNLYTAGNGFDAVSNSSSILTYNNGTSSWNFNLDNTHNTELDDYPGYMLFVRGDRNYNTGNAPATNRTVLRAKGELYQGDQIRTVLDAAGRTLIGNPYASPVDMEPIFAANETNLNQNMYVWDPTLTGNYGVGGYWIVQRTAANTYTRTPVVITDPAGGSYPNGRYLHSGQAVLMKASNDHVNITFTESMKTGSVSPVDPIVGVVGDQQIFANLLVVNAGNTTVLADGFRVRYDATYQTAITDDIEKLGNFGENLSSYREAKRFIIEQRPMIGARDTIFMRTSNMGIKNYRFEIGSFDFVQANVTAYLEDTWLNTLTGLNLMGPVNYVDFAVTADPASANANRFRIVFAAAGPLPVTITSVKAAQTAGPGGQGSNILVEWKASNQYNMKQYEVEKSTDGVNYTKVNTQAAIGTNGSDATYTWLDVNPVMGNAQHPADNFYRIRSIGIGGDIKISQVVVVKIGKGNPAITIYPNPVTNRTIGLQFTDMEKGIYQLRLINSVGQVVFTGQVNHNGGSAAQTVPIDKGIANGNYQLEIMKPGNDRVVKSIIITY